MFTKSFYLILLIIINNNLFADNLKDTTIQNHHFYYTHDISSLRIFQNEKKIFFTNDESSSVLTISNDTLKEYGWTTKHFGLQHSAFIVIDSLLYSFGGYGFWKDNNVLRYFDKSKGWIPIVIQNGDPLEYAHASIMIYSDSLLYIFCGKSIDQKNPFISKNNLNLLKIDISKRHCKKIPLKFPISRENIVCRDNTGIIVDNGSSYLLYRLGTDRYFNLYKNEILFNEIGANWRLDGDSIVSVTGNKYAIDKIFELEPDPTVQFIPIIIATLIVLIIYLVCQKLSKSKIKVERLVYSQGCLQFGNEKILLSYDANNVLKEFMIRKTIKGNELNEMLDTGYISNSNLLKKRRDVIIELNSTCEKISGNQLISMDTDLNDKRQRIYRLNDGVLYSQ